MPRGGSFWPIVGATARTEAPDSHFRPPPPLIAGLQARPMPPTPPIPHHSIESLTVSRGIHFRDVTFEFHDLLNFLIGARGTGRGRAPPHSLRARGSHPRGVRRRLRRLHRRDSRDGNGHGRARTRHGVRYTSSRTHGSLPVVKDENGKVVDVKLVGELFQIQAYAQERARGDREERGVAARAD